MNRLEISVCIPAYIRFYFVCVSDHPEESGGEDI